MEKSRRIKVFNAISSVLNLALILLTTYSIVHYVAIGSGRLFSVNIDCLKIFDVDVNILIGISAWLMLMFNIKKISFHNNTEIPKGLRTIKLIAVISGVVIFFVSVFFLGPKDGYRTVFSGDNMLLHFVNPLLAIVSFTFFEFGEKIEAPMASLALLPAVAYYIIYVIKAVVTNSWTDFYGLGQNSKWLLFSCIIFCIAIVISALVLMTNRRLRKFLKF